MQNLENSRFDKQNLENSRFDIQNLEISRFDMQNLENVNIKIDMPRRERPLLAGKKFQDLTAESWNFKVWHAGSWIFKIWHAESRKFQDLTCRILKIRDLVCRILKFQDLTCKILNIQNLTCRILKLFLVYAISSPSFISSAATSIHFIGPIFSFLYRIRMMSQTIKPTNRAFSARHHGRGFNNLVLGIALTRAILSQLANNNNNNNYNNYNGLIHTSMVCLFAWYKSKIRKLKKIIHKSELWICKKLGNKQ